MRRKGRKMIIRCEICDLRAPPDQEKLINTVVSLYQLPMPPRFACPDCVDKLNKKIDFEENQQLN